MKVRICSLSKNEDFRSILNGKKRVNKYSTIFFRKLDNTNSKHLNISFIAKKIVFNHRFEDIKQELFLDFEKIK